MEKFNMQAGIVMFPGTNRERDMYIALEMATGKKPKIIWHKETEISNFDLIVIPGGFSYGDYLRCGAMAAKSPIMLEIYKHFQRGGYVLGVCNGMQILTEAGFLPGVMMHNAGLRFLSMDCHLQVQRDDTAFTKKYFSGQVIRSPMAHGDGNFFADNKTLDRLEGDGLIAFRYVTQNGHITKEANLNGSARNIAGIYSKNLRVLGLMPHLEDLVDPLIGGIDGKAMFDSLVSAF